MGNSTSQPDVSLEWQGTVSADQAQLHLCWKDSTAMLSRECSQTHPRGPQGSGPKEERNKELQ